MDVSLLNPMLIVLGVVMLGLFLMALDSDDNDGGSV